MKSLKRNTLRRQYEDDRDRIIDSYRRNKENVRATAVELNIRESTLYRKLYEWEVRKPGRFQPPADKSEAAQIDVRITTTLTIGEHTVTIWTPSRRMTAAVLATFCMEIPEEVPASGK